MGTFAIEFEARAEKLRSQIASLEADFNAGRRRLDELDEELAANRKRHEIVLEQQARLDEKIGVARDELEKLEELVPAAKPKVVAQAKGPEPRDINQDQIRAGILRFRVFTVAEIAGYLRVTNKKAEAMLEAEQALGVCRPTGERFGRSPQWEYTPPTEPGAAFEVQQASRPKGDDVVFADAVNGLADGYLARLPKEVRVVARHAVRELGWTLAPTGSGHMQLMRDGEVITISKTPQNVGEEAKALRRRLGKASQRRVQRGTPVPGTGRPVGSSGRPGFDKARAEAGKTVVRRKR